MLFNSFCSNVAKHVARFCSPLYRTFSPVHTYLDIFENGDFFSVLGYRPHLSGHQKRTFLKAFPRIKIFENIVLPFSIELTKTEVSDYDHDDVRTSYLVRYVSVYVWMLKHKQTQESYNRFQFIN